MIDRTPIDLRWHADATALKMGGSRGSPKTCLFSSRRLATLFWLRSAEAENMTTVAVEQRRLHLHFPVMAKGGGETTERSTSSRLAFDDDNSKEAELKNNH
ncbi:hypothetical protein Q1695_014827 [Nippostrongylus brasiliensis]|nr:hypothetical protein Q1695_014827 [Nippostrongylus brasiliensis]